jgi:tetratricopeptide (TPR) repeat protein
VDAGNYDQAIVETSRAISIDPRNVRAYSNRAFARGRKGDLAGAIADTTRAIEIDPRWIAAYIVRGDSYAKKRRARYGFCRLRQGGTNRS